MSTANVSIRVGTTTAWVKPEHYDATIVALHKASKIPTVKQARAAALRGGISRKYPKFTEGMTPADYAQQYTMLNARQSGHGIQRGQFLSGADVLREQAWILDFYQPLSTLPMFTPSDEVLEETI